MARVSRIGGEVPAGEQLASFDGRILNSEIDEIVPDQALRPSDAREHADDRITELFGAIHDETSLRTIVAQLSPSDFLQLGRNFYFSRVPEFPVSKETVELLAEKAFASIASVVDEAKRDRLTLERYIVDLDFFEYLQDENGDYVYRYLYDVLESHIQKREHLPVVRAWIAMLSQEMMSPPETFFKFASDVYFLPFSHFEGDEQSDFSLICTDLTVASVARFAEDQRTLPYFESLLAETPGQPHFGRISKALELLRVVFNRSTAEVWSRGAPDRIRALVNDFEARTDNYLLKSRARTVLREIERAFDSLDRSGGMESDDIVEDQYQEWKRRDFYSEQLDPRVLGRRRVILQTLSPDKVGVYDSLGFLEQYLERSQMKDGLLPSLHQATEMDPFLARADIVPEHESQRLADLNDYIFLTSLPMRDQLRADLGIDLSAHDVRTQQYFLNFLKTKTLAEVRNVADYYRDYGADFLTAFLSLEHGASMGEIILKIGAELPESAAEIFKKYALIAKTAEKARENIQADFGDEIAADDKIVDRVVERMLYRGKKLLTEYAGRPEEHQNILFELENINAGLLLTIDVLREGGDPVELRTYGNFEVEFYDENIPLPMVIRQQMIGIVRSNWSIHKKMVEAVVAGAETATENLHNTQFTVIKYEGEVIAFWRLDHDPTKPGHLHLASVNVTTSKRGQGLGEVLLDKTFAQQARGKIVEAESYPPDPISSKYIGAWAFVGKKMVPFGDTGEWAMEIVRDDIKKPKYQNSGKSYDELAAHFDDQIMKRFNLNTSYLEFLDFVQRELSTGRKVVSAMPRTRAGECIVVLEDQIDDVPMAALLAA